MPASFQSIDYQVEGELTQTTPQAVQHARQAWAVWSFAIDPTPSHPALSPSPLPPLLAATSGPSLTVQYFNTYKATGVQSIMAAATGQPQEWIETSGTNPPSPAAPAPARRRLLQTSSGRVLVLNKVCGLAGAGGSTPDCMCTFHLLARQGQARRPLATFGSCPSDASDTLHPSPLRCRRCMATRSSCRA